MTLTSADRDKLARLLGMIGSDHDGEALNAARLADRLIRSRGLSWYDVLDMPPPDDGDQFARFGGWRGAVQVCLRNADLLDEWQRDFCTKLSRYIGEASPKQRNILAALVDRCMAANDAGGVR